VREEAVFVKEREEFATKQSSYWAARLVLLPARFLLLTQMGFDVLRARMDRPFYGF
jgi:hypothetical protein